MAYSSDERRALTAHLQALEEQGQVLATIETGAGSMSVVRPIMHEFQRINAEFPGVIALFDTTSVSVDGVRLQVASAVGRLSQALDTPAGSKAAEPTGDILEGHPIRLFISHSHSDSTAAECLAELFQAACGLSAENIRCSSVAKYSLPFGVDLPRQVKEEVLASSVLVALVTRRSRESAWVLFEMGARWGTSRSLISIMAADGDAELLPPPIRHTHAMTCSYENVLKLVEQVADILGSSVPRTSVYTRRIDDVVNALKNDGAPETKTNVSPEALRHIADTRTIKASLREIRRRWPDSQVLLAPLDRYTWGAAIGQKQIDADVQEAMRLHDRIREYATELQREYPEEFDLAAIMQDQYWRKGYNAERFLDLLDGYVDRFQDMYMAPNAV